MPDPKDNAKMTGDTHLPDVESDMPFQESSTDAVGQDGTPQDRGQATERGDRQRRGRGANKAGVPKDRKADTSDSNGNTRDSGEGSGPGRS
jgi:hypothetical protein